MRVSFDKEADAAYIRLSDDVRHPFETVPVQGIGEWMINLDFDADGRLAGIEVLDARKLLPREFLDRFGNSSAEPS
jgi:uncharacterized protein YuzE